MSFGQQVSWRNRLMASRRQANEASLSSSLQPRGPRRKKENVYLALTILTTGVEPQ